MIFRLIGVGFETIGLEEFKEGNFFAGELFIDETRESYNKLGFVRFGLKEFLPMVFSWKFLESSQKAFWMGLGKS